MKENRKVLGVIVSVEGTESHVGMYNMSNDAEFIWYGDILTGPKIGAFLTIHQNDIRIIATVSTEKIIDQQNSMKSEQFDNRYSKGSINRIVVLKTKGVIDEAGFTVTSKHVPMIGNEVSLTTKKELGIIYGIHNNTPTILIGESILEGQSIQLSINNFFASHIGIFGNTGSGKSNTLHKLYLELFRSEYYEGIIQKSQFFIIDFNGEYISNNMFGISGDSKEVFEVNTRDEKRGTKLPIKKEYLFDADILSILFDARPATQVPFLRKAITLFNEKIIDVNFDFGAFVTGTLKKILTTGTSSNQDSLQDWIQIAKNYYSDSDVYSEIDQIQFYNNGAYSIPSRRIWFNSGADEGVDKDIWNQTKVNDVSRELKNVFDNLQYEPIKQLKMFLDFQKVHVTAWGKVNREHLNPLFSRMDSSLTSLENVIVVQDEILNAYKAMNIISLVHANQEVSRLIPMIISKMIYDEQKADVSGENVTQTKHLIIDEAHNILNDVFRNNGDDWQDYRLSVFEEIIKEGRKFGFYLTLSSQRPADISQTILSQIHNYVIHRLVNDNDLRMLENTMPTLDRGSFQVIPSLGKGEVVITGNSIQVPVFVKIPKEEVIRPTSDDVLLTSLWGNNKF